MDDAPTRIDPKLTDPDRPPEYLRRSEAQPPAWLKDFLPDISDSVVYVWFGNPPEGAPLDVHLFCDGDGVWFWRKL